MANLARGLRRRLASPGTCRGPALIGPTLDPETKIGSFYVGLLSPQLPVYRTVMADHTSRCTAARSHNASTGRGVQP
jgi:hypothetical protein